MKKGIILLLAMVFMLGIFNTALATPFYLEVLGVTVEVPEGMTAADMSDENAYMLGITVDGNEALRYAYTLSYLEEFEGKYIEDLTDEEGQQLLQGVAQALENPSFGALQTEPYSLLLAANGDGTQLHYISVLNGWLCDVAVGKSDGVQLADDEIKAAAEILLSIQFDEVEGEEAEEAAE